MIDVVLESIGQDEATIQNWFVEEGDQVVEGDDLVEVMTETGAVTITAPASGLLAEVYYDEGDLVAKGEVLCAIDEEES